MAFIWLGFRRWHATHPENKPREIEVVMFGDSLTAGGEWVYLTKMNNIINSGMSGYNTSQFINEIPGRVLIYHPKICYIEGGINDVFVGIPINRTLKNIDAIIDSLINHKVIPVLQSVLLTTDSLTNLKCSELNLKYIELAKIKNIKYLDINRHIAKTGILPEIYSEDGVHLKKAAYQIWASIIVEDLSKRR